MQLTQDSRSAISRAQFFLRKAEGAPAEARVDFEAFLEAAIVFARAAVHRLKTKHEKHSKWRPWWDSILKNPSVTFFRTERNWILKDASPKIGQKVFAASVGPGPAEATGYAPKRAAEFYYFDDPGTLATETVRRHLSHLAQLLETAERQFI